MHVDEDGGDVLVAGLAAWRGVALGQKSKHLAREQGVPRMEAREERRGRKTATNHLVNALPSLERLRTVASTRFLVRAALAVDLAPPPAMDG